MTLRSRKWFVVCVIVLTIALANATPLASWCDRMGIISFADMVSRRFITKTAVSVILALLVLLVDHSPERLNDLSNRCRVCDHQVLASGRYCPHCGSRA